MRKLSLSVIIGLIAALFSIGQASAATNVTVDNANTDGWTLYQGMTTASAALVNGPASPPLGTGSLEFKVGTDGNDLAEARNVDYAGTKLTDLTKLSYSTYVTANADCQAAYLILNVDNTGDGMADDRLFFEPCYQDGTYGTVGTDTIATQPAVALNTWQQWDALNGGWWALSDGSGGPPLHSLAGYEALNPGSTIVNATGTGKGGVRIAAGGGASAWDNFVGNAGAFTIGVSSNDTTFDFERGVKTFVVDDDGFATKANCDDLTTPAYTTIQAGVNDASPGDIVKVCPGAYPELVNVDKTLTLDGAQAGNDARTRSNPVSEDSVVGQPNGAFKIDANNVTIDGFTVQGVTSDGGPSSLNAGIWTNPGTGNGHQILNNIIQDNVIGIYLNSTGENPTLVKHNLIQSNNNAGPAGGTGIYSELGLENATITENLIQNDSNTAINLIGAGGTAVVNPIVVSKNTILNDGAIALFNSYDVEITQNKSTNANGSAVFIGGSDSDIHLDKNVLVNAASAGVKVADPYSLGPNDNILVEHGGLRKDSPGVLLADGAISDTLEVHRVKIATTNTDGVVNQDTDPGGSVIDASNNWWGRSSGPSDWGIGVGASTSAEVDFFPWALHPTFASFQPCDVLGTAGNDPALTGTPGKDVICGLGGDDTLKGLGGRDLLLGGDGNDILQGGSANDALIGGIGDDNLQGQQGLDDTGQGRDGTDTCDASTERTSTCSP